MNDIEKKITDKIIAVFVKYNCSDESALKILSVILTSSLVIAKLDRNNAYRFLLNLFDQYNGIKTDYEEIEKNNKEQQ